MSTETHSATMALVIDWTACDGRGLCLELLPELLESDPWGYPKARAGTAGGGVLAAVPDGVMMHARKAVHLSLLALRPEAQ